MPCIRFACTAPLLILLSLLTFTTYTHGYSINIGKCPRPPPNPAGNWSSFATAKPFTLDIGSGYPSQQTQVHLCYTNDSLHVKFEAIDHKIYSTFTQCNEPLYQQDAVEMFLTNPYHVDLQHYLELELSPHGVLFASKIYNPVRPFVLSFQLILILVQNYICTGIQGTLVDCKETGIQYEAKTFPAENRWWGYLKVPFKLLKTIGSKKVVNILESKDLAMFDDWKGNFYRINYIGDSTSKEYSCWSPTFANPPCFHKPKFFGTLVLH